MRSKSAETLVFGNVNFASANISSSLLAGDTETSEGLADYIREADVLVIEATFLDRDAAIVRGHGHLTAAEAGALAVMGDVRLLVLTHISGRYTVATTGFDGLGFHDTYFRRCASRGSDSVFEPPVPTTRCKGIAVRCGLKSLRPDRHARAIENTAMKMNVKTPQNWQELIRAVTALVTAMSTAAATGHMIGWW